MSRIILACALAGILGVPAQALDGTRSPGTVPPIIGVPPGNNPNIQDWQLRRAADELLAQSRQLRRATDELFLAQANPGATPSLKDQLVGTWALVSCPGPWCVGSNGTAIY